MSKMRDRNNCSGGGEYRTFAVNVNKQHNGKNGKQHTAAKVATPKTPTTETVKLSADGAIRVDEFKRIVAELVAAGKKEGAYEGHHEEVRQMIVGIINDAFGYSALDAQGTDDLAENQDAMRSDTERQLSPSVDDDDDDARDADLENDELARQGSGDIGL